LIETGRVCGDMARLMTARRPYLPLVVILMNGFLRR
jgi:hypothetical protein